MKLAVRALVVVALLVAQSPAWSGQEGSSGPDRLLLILDASGSMWGQVGGESKVVIARRVVGDLLARLDQHSEVGLVAYGHRREQDCQDIELVQPLAPLDRAALTRQLEALTPKGKTPLSAAMSTALDTVRGAAGGTTVVLFTDGLETCGGDPCRVAAEARAAGVDFVLHVIGFDVAKEEVAELECAAQATGGLYLAADSAAELDAAFARAVSVDEAGDAVLAVEAVANGALVDATVRVFRHGSREEVASGRSYTAAATNPRRLPLPAGDYDVEVHAVRLDGEPVISFAGLRLAAGATVAKVADFSTGELAVKVTRNGALSDATVAVYPAGADKALASGRSYTAATSNPRVFRLVAGRYDVVVTALEIANKPEQRLTELTVSAGARAEVAHDFASGTLRVGALLGGEPVDATVQLRDTASGAAVAGGRISSSGATRHKSFELAPGRYLVTVTPVQAKTAPASSLEVTVAAAETVERTVELIAAAAAS